MKRIAMYALLVALLVGIVYLVWRDPVTQGVVRSHAPASGDADVARLFMSGMCERDEAKMRAASGVPFSEWTDEHWHAAVGALTPCSGLRYLGAVASQRGPEFVFVLVLPEGEEWFVVGTVGGKVVSVK